MRPKACGLVDGTFDGSFAAGLDIAWDMIHNTTSPWAVLLPAMAFNISVPFWLYISSFLVVGLIRKTVLMRLCRGCPVSSPLHHPQRDGVCQFKHGAR